MSKSSNTSSTENIKHLKVIERFRDRYTFEFYEPGYLFEEDDSIKSANDTKRVDNTNTFKVSKTRYAEISNLKYVIEK